MEACWWCNLRERERLCEGHDRELRRDMCDGNFPSRERGRKVRGGERVSERE